ncbi:hypothetical protein [Nocardia terpenica]|nr:hypothetical protein [Nocardia terpenica]
MSCSPDRLPRNGIRLSARMHAIPAVDIDRLRQPSGQEDHSVAETHAAQ